MVCPRPDRPSSPPNLLYGGNRVTFLGIKPQGRGFDHLSHLVSRLKKKQELPVLPLWAFVACRRVNSCSSSSSSSSNNNTLVGL